jgi:oligopeptidase B
VRFVPAVRSAAEPVLISRRSRTMQYSADAAHGKLWIVTNDDHVNFRLAEADPATAGRMADGDRGFGPVYLRGVTAFATISRSPSG